jgi:uncharacterized protein YkwD
MRNQDLLVRILYLVLPSLIVLATMGAILMARGEPLPVTYAMVAGTREIASQTPESRLAYISSFERALHEARTAHKLPRLQRSTGLDRVAQAYAEEMASKRFFDHISPDGTEPYQRVEIHSPSSIIFGVRENLSYAHSSHPDPVWVRAARAHEALMESPGHRTNILHADPTHVGIGVASVWREGYLADYVVQLFGVDAGTWLQGRPRIVSGSEQSLEIPVSINFGDVEFLLDNPGQPRQAYRVPGERSTYSIGSVKLTLDLPGKRLLAPGLDPGRYTLHGRVRGRTEGWFRVLDFEVESSPRRAMAIP